MNTQDLAAQFLAQRAALQAELATLPADYVLTFPKSGFWCLAKGRKHNVGVMFAERFETANCDGLIVHNGKQERGVPMPRVEVIMETIKELDSVIAQLEE